MYFNVATIDSIDLQMILTMNVCFLTESKQISAICVTTMEFFFIKTNKLHKPFRESIATRQTHHLNMNSLLVLIHKTNDALSMIDTRNANLTHVRLESVTFCVITLSNTNLILCTNRVCCPLC